MLVTIPVVIAGLAVIIATVYAAMGRGGEMSGERSDYAPLELGPVSATDVALFRPSSAMWGYDVRVTDEALERIAISIRDRDVRIVALEQLVTDLSRVTSSVPSASSPPPSARHRRDPETQAPPPVPGTQVPLPPPVSGIPAPLPPLVPEPPTVPQIPVSSGPPPVPDTMAAAPTVEPAGESASARDQEEQQDDPEHFDG